MLQDPIGVIVFLVSLIFWAVAIFKPVKQKETKEGDAPPGDTGGRLGALVASVGFLIVLTLATSIGLYKLLQTFESSPGTSSLLLAGIAFVGWLLLARPERFAQLLIGGLIVFGGIGLLGQCSSKGGNSFEYHPPRSL